MILNRAQLYSRMQATLYPATTKRTVVVEEPIMIKRLAHLS